MFFIRACQIVGFRHYRFAFRQRACFVESDAIHGREVLDRDATLEEDTAFGCIGNGGKDSRSGRCHQGARRSDRQQYHAAIE